MLDPPISSRLWHNRRAMGILTQHPEVRALEGPTLWTAAAIACLLALHSALAVFAAGLPWPMLALLAWTIGAIPALGLFVLLHEASHNLVFRSDKANRWIMIAAGAPLVLPCAVNFRHYHLEHHRHLGDPWRDADVPARLEVALRDRTVAGRTAWLALFPLLQSVRIAAKRPHRLFDRWFAGNCAVNLAYASAIVSVGGVSALVFQLLSMIFALGLHPFGARWVQEHASLAPHQPTASYYGPANRMLFNAGYHVEHHDFMRIPWLHLPRLRRIANRHYAPLAAYRSWTALLLRFLAEPRRRSVGDAQVAHGQRDRSDELGLTGDPDFGEDRLHVGFHGVG